MERKDLSEDIVFYGCDFMTSLDEKFIDVIRLVRKRPNIFFVKKEDVGRLCEILASIKEISQKYSSCEIFSSFAGHLSCFCDVFLEMLEKECDKDVLDNIVIEVIQSLIPVSGRICEYENSRDYSDAELSLVLSLCEFLRLKQEQC